MAQTESDRNLLFGILALQMDFISRDDLIAAMDAWVVQKHRPLADVLQSAARCAGRPLAARAAGRRHIEQHGGDPARSLAALSSAERLRGDLATAARNDPDVQASLACPGAGELRQAWPATLAPSEPSAMASIGMLHVRRPAVPHPPAPRQGRAWARSTSPATTSCNREVALKQIQDRHADHPESRSRFLLEAEITGGLEHPGIVPVYGLGHYPDGRPFYAMRFIRGDSLKEAIARFHRADEQPGRDPGERALALRQLLGRFVDVCNAIAYAHSRGVLHRDLKPGNVMLGPYRRDAGGRLGAGQADRPAGGRGGPRPSGRCGRRRAAVGRRRRWARRSARRPT